MRILLIYKGWSTDVLAPLKRRLEDKYNEPRIFHVPDDGISDFISEKTEFNLVFFDSNIDPTLIASFFAYSKSTKIIKGITLDDEEVNNCLSSL